ncbi:O-antigen ligase family protein [Membranihabitans maritimus]|uniref:O-antigen ligase family protein n=1 Tax=Membranihabitans maritimus TaxID=2904244 RepID=UPI001F3CFA0C|nr:O-antigen ligase family protein [Membranihabitans maritimus]
MRIEKPYLTLLTILPILTYLVFFKTEALWWAIILFTPLSINLEEYLNDQLGLFIPTEIILALFFILTPLYFLKYPPEKKFLQHPISIIVLLMLSWGLLTSITSEQVFVSIKNWVSRTWYVLPLFYLGSKILNTTQKKERVLLLYTISFSVVVLYTFLRLYMNGFPEKASQWLMQPFFKDHTILGAALGLTIPYVYMKVFEQPIKTGPKAFWILGAILFTLVLIFTYSRAAILSLVIAAAVYFIARLKISLRVIYSFLAVASILLVINRQTLINQLSQNKAESSDQVVENIESISNITTDASNVERINRWNSALEMWKERPVFGWGPGTYQFNYAPFQNSNDLTIISTNFGDVGNAHSEVLGALAESGLPGAIFMVLFILFVIFFGYKNIPLTTGKDKLVLTSSLLGFIAYFAHGMLNNFLTSDKAAVPVWIFALIIILYDIKNN